MDATIGSLPVVTVTTEQYMNTPLSVVTSDSLTQEAADISITPNTNVILGTNSCVQAVTPTSADDGNSQSMMTEPPELSVVEPLCEVTTDTSLDPPNLTPITLPVVTPREVDSTLEYSGELTTQCPYPW